MRRKLLLIVDEDRLLGDLVKSSLESAELEVRVAGSADEAESGVSASEPDLILIDPAIAQGNHLLESWHQRIESRRLVAIVDSDLTRRMARRAGLEVLDKKDGLSDLIHLLRTRLKVTGGASKPGRHVLVVDDEEEVRKVLAEFLAGGGYTVSAAADGQEALDSIDRAPSISVVLLDINMPRLGGLSALAEIRKRTDPPDVIMMTGIADQQIANHAMELGAFDYILKPLDPQRVESTISACLSHRQYRGKSFWKRLIGG